MIFQYLKVWLLARQIFWHGHHSLAEREPAHRADTNRSSVSTIALRAQADISTSRNFKTQRYYTFINVFYLRL